MNVSAISLDQQPVEAFLAATSRGRIPALLFTGPEGSGKELTAIDFARRLCCSRDPVCDGVGDACDSCASALKLEHPGIHIVYGTPTQGSGEKPGDDEPDIGKVLDVKRADIFAAHDFKKKPSIRIARARAIIQRANSKPFNSLLNVFIIVDAHLMREEAQNALLKLVEEPPEHSVIVMTTSLPDLILHTMRSRCQRVRFAPLTVAAIERILTESYDVPANQAAKTAGLARGNIKRAIALAEQDDEEERQTAYTILRGLREGSVAWMVDNAAAVSRGAGRDRVARFLHELAVAYRDMMSNDDTLFINRDQTEMLSDERSKWNARALPAIVERIVNTRDDILRRNLNAEAALVDLFQQIQRSQGRGA